MRLLNLFKNHRNEYQESSWGGGGEGRPAHKADNLTTISIADCIENAGASTSHIPMCLDGLLQGYLHLLTMHCVGKMKNVLMSK
jgi:hypothetical protein